MIELSDVFLLEAAISRLVCCDHREIDVGQQQHCLNNAYSVPRGQKRDKKISLKSLYSKQLELLIHSKAD